MFTKGDIFIGTVKRCTDYSSYEQYGETRMAWEYQIGPMEFGSIFRYYEVVDQNAVLIKVGERYIWTNQISSIVDELLVDLGLPISAIYTKPSMKNTLYVDESTLKHYYEQENQNDHVKVKQLKRDICVKFTDGIGR